MSKSKTPCRSVLITFHGNTTHATKLTGYDHDTRTKSACAKCHKDDEYSAYEGARVALARLYGVDPFPAAAEPTPKEPTPKEPTPKKPVSFRVEVNLIPVFEEG